MVRSRGLRSILLGRLVGRLHPREAQIALQALGPAPRLSKLQQRPQSTQTNPIIDAVRELTPEEVKALPPKLAEAILTELQPRAGSANSSGA